MAFGFRVRFLDYGVQVVTLHLIAFGEDDLIGNRGFVQATHDFPVTIFQPVTGVDQKVDAQQLAAASEIVPDQPGPLADQAFGGSGIAVTRQVHEKQFLAQGEEIEQLRPSGRIGGSGERLSSRKSVDQARFPDVRAAREGNLRQAVAGQVADVIGAS